MIGDALARAGNRVFMGDDDGYLDAFGTTNGKKLWCFNWADGVNALPITCSVDGVQYIAVAASGNFKTGLACVDTIAVVELPKKLTCNMVPRAYRRRAPPRP